MSDRTYGILVTVNLPIGWVTEDIDYLVERIDFATATLINREDYTIQEFEK